MTNFQKLGGVAALIEAATYVVGFALLFTLLAPLAGDLEPSQYGAFLAENQATIYLWNLIIYVVNGVFLVVLVLALHARLQTGAPAMVGSPLGAATAFGLIWAALVIASGMLIINNMGVILNLYSTDPAQAASVWVGLKAVEEGLGGGVELPGGLWVLLVSGVALRGGGLPKALNFLGIVIGLAGILTLVPSLDVFEAVFGLGFIVWFLWAGIVLLRSNPSAASNSEMLKTNRPLPSP